LLNQGVFGTSEGDWGVHIRMKIAKLALLICPLALAAPRSSEGQAKIAGGTKATSYPWMAAVASTTGGSLFDRQF
jgi:hypothetical protein